MAKKKEAEPAGFTSVLVERVIADLDEIDGVVISTTPNNSIQSEVARGVRAAIVSGAISSDQLVVFRKAVKKNNARGAVGVKPYLRRRKCPAHE